MACVYSLSSSLDPGVVRYIGRANKDGVGARLKKHLEEARYGIRTHKNNWVRSVVSADGEIIATVLESNLTWKESGVREMFYIAHHRDAGDGLTNMTDGGEGIVGLVRSAEHRANLSASGMGHTVSEETRDKLRAANLGKIPSPDTLAKRSTALRGRVFSAEHRAKLSAALLGRTLTPEHCANLSAATSGRTLTAEHRANISAGLRRHDGIQDKVK